MKLNLKQAEFRALKTKFKAYVAGFGSGKTYIGSICMAEHFGNYPKVNQGFFAPTYGLIRDVFYPTFKEVCAEMGFRCVVRKGDHEVDVYRGKWYYGTVICRSMDNPDNLVGFKIGNALVDELDIMKESKARQAWNKIIARLRWAEMQNGIMVTTTPEGFRFTYQKFKKNPTPSYGLVQASTYDNERLLPDGYIGSLVESYDPKMVEAYLDGQFVNLLSGNVYPSYNVQLNGSFEKANDSETLYIGMDFNVRKMSAVIHVKRSNGWHAVDEVFKVLDTPSMILELKRRYPSNRIWIYPDAAGHNTSSKCGNTSDHSLLRDAGFNVVVDGVNPAIRDRVNAMNGAFCSATGHRAYFVNALRCPEYSSCLEQQPWNDFGMPDKSNDLDHLPDAGGYFIAKVLPVERPASLAGLGFAA